MDTTGKVVLGIIVVIIVLGGGWYAFAHKGASTSTPVQTATTTATDQSGASSGDTSSNTSNPATGGTAISVGVSAGTHKTVTVTYTNQGFSPKNVSIAIGDTVHFVNQSSHGMWVASDVHPSHAAYDGTTLQQHCSGGADTKGGFDECTAVQSGSTYSFTFPKAGTFQYHNHVQASDTGTVVVAQ